MLSPLDLWQSGVIALDVAAASYAGRAGVLARQRRRLAALLVHATEHSALVRERLGRRDPTTTPLTDIAPVSKAELMHRFAHWVCDPRLELKALREFAADPALIGQACPGGHLLWTSSGSSGEPALFVQDAEALAVYDALEALRRPRLRPFSGWMGERVAFVGATTGHFASTVSLERLRRLVPGAASLLRGFSFLQPTPQLLRELEAFAPSVLATYPTVALLLAEELRAGRTKLQLAEVWTGGETLTHGMRAAIEQAFGCRVGNSYGASEFLALASECRLGVLHLNADWAILEAVDEHYAPVPDGQAGHTCLLTNLANRLQPLIRYDLGDRIILHAEPCACGSPLPALDVEGRCDELLVLRDGRGASQRLAPLALTTVIEDDAGVFAFQLEQSHANALFLRIAEGGASGQRALAKAQQALRRYLAQQGLANVRLEGASGMPPERASSGKQCRVLGPSRAVRGGRRAPAPRGSRKPSA